MRLPGEIAKGSRHKISFRYTHLDQAIFNNPKAATLFGAGTAVPYSKVIKSVNYITPSLQNPAATNRYSRRIDAELGTKGRLAWYLGVSVYQRSDRRHRAITKDSFRPCLSLSIRGAILAKVCSAFTSAYSTLLQRILY